MTQSRNGNGFGRSTLEQEQISASVDELLAKALLISSSADDELKSARDTRSKAEERLAHAEMEALAMAEKRRQQIVEEAENHLKQARLLHSDAEKAKQEAQRQLEEAARARSEADEYRAQVEKAADEQARLVIAEAREAGRLEVEQMKHEAAEEIRQRIKDIDTLRAAVREELEAQRLLTRAAEVRARYSRVLEETKGVAKPAADGPAVQADVTAQVQDEAPKRKARKADAEG